MSEAANALPSGYLLHEYRIDSLLGAGGFGLTYLATDANLKLKVALKEYLPGDIASRADDSTVRPRTSSETDSFKWGLHRFMEEARTLASFRHPNIVRVMRFFEANQTGYMVMEFVEGTALPQWVEPRRPLPQASVLGLAGPVLDGLEVIHAAGYLHRDIKPANVFIRSDGSPVLLDFGSARQLTGGNRELTAVVTPGYAPFEQYHTHGKQGPWTDLYALGGVLYWLVCGQKPVEAAARIRKDIMTPATEAAAALYASQLLAAIDWALKPNEEERPQSVGEFRRAIAAARPASSDHTVSLAMPDTPTVVAGGPPPIARPQVQPGTMTGFTGLALDRAELKRVEAELAQRIGPIAAMVVRNAAKTAISIEALAQAVVKEIDDEKERAVFLRKFSQGETSTGATRAPSRPVPDQSISQKFSASILKQAETTLAQHIGAIARVVVNRAAAKARDEAELYLLISDEIKDPAERRTFIRKAVYASSKR